jgi:hypothetical protein
MKAFKLQFQVYGTNFPTWTCLALSSVDRPEKPEQILPSLSPTSTQCHTVNGRHPPIVVSIHGQNRIGDEPTMIHDEMESSETIGEGENQGGSMGGSDSNTMSISSRCKTELLATLSRLLDIIALS